MKKIIYALLGSLLSAGSAFGQVQINGTLTGVGSDTLLFESYPVQNRDKLSTDTIALQNEKFALSFGNELRVGYLYAKPSLKPDAQGRIPAVSTRGIRLILLSGQPLTITGSLDNYQLSGSDFYKELYAVENSYKIYKDKRDSVANICTALQRSGVSNDSIGKVYAQTREWSKAKQQIMREYVQQHLDNDVAVYVLSQLSIEDLGDNLEKLSESVKTGAMAPIYQSLKATYAKEMVRKAAKEKIAPGSPAPEFTLKDLDGKNFSLSSLKGKYVVLDFWGSWCGWCIKGVPDMKKAYEKYKDKVEFVGIDCNDTEKKWKEAVAQHQLPWINVHNVGEPDVSALYGISGYPTKCVIDPEGKIVKVVVGESPTFYTFLGELFK